jgi:ATP synthase F1 delta subunit
MLERWESLIKKYAQAFIHLYGNQLSDVIVDNITACSTFLEKHKNIDIFMLLSVIPRTEKIALLEKVYDSFKLPSGFLNLGHTLLEHRRIDLLTKILQKIIHEYQAQKNIINFTVYTSHTINDKAQKALISFIQKKVPQKIVVNFSMDSTLICGVKIKSDMLQWERSIAKQLKITKLEALQQVQL